MDITDIKNNLGRRDISQLLTIEFGTEPIVIGAPHHTLGGTAKMVCGREGDENTGYLALILAEHLRGQCIIAHNYWLDPNKICNDYLHFIKLKNPQNLIEIHGHGGSAKSYIEISCGTEELSDRSEKLAEFINDEIRILEKIDSFWNDVSVCGTFSEIKYKAQEALSLRYVRECDATPFHIEIYPKLRKDEKNRVPEQGNKFMEVIANSLKKIRYL
ncbi:MAG: hypothetical protein FP824_07775 [Euryarchaeota archaeon]|nr:hypothetical protein [Euryarchaeota archaeon]